MPRPSFSTSSPNHHVIGLVVSGFPLFLAVLLVPQIAYAQAFVGFLAGRAAGGAFHRSRADITLNAGVWVVDWAGAEVRVDSLLGAFEIPDAPERVPLSSISILDVDLAVAPIGHTGKVKPFAAVGVGRARSIIDSSAGAYRSTDRTTSVSAGILGGQKGIWWRLECRRTVFQSFVTTPDLVSERPSFWAISAGLGFVFFAD